MNTRQAMQMVCRSLLGVALGAAALLGTGAFAQSPGTVRMVVGSPPAALGDVVTRLVADKFREATGSTTVVENRPGASGLIAADLVAKSAGDGNTLLIAPDNVMVVNPLVFPKMPYDPVKDFRAVGLLGKATLVLVANPQAGIKSMNDLIQVAKDKPDSLVYSSGGVGHVTHLGVELIKDKLGLKIRHIPYNGTSPALKAALANEVQLMYLGLSGAMPQIKAGKLIALAASGPAARENFPGLPLLTDFHPDLDISVWFGVFASGQTSPETVARLNRTVNAVLQQAELVKKFGDYGMTTQPGTPAALETLVKEDTLRFGTLIKSLNFKLE